MSGSMMLSIGLCALVVAIVVAIFFIKSNREHKKYIRSLKMVPMLIHLPPSTDDIEIGGRDERDVNQEQISEAQVMYSIIASTLKKGLHGRLFGQKSLSFEIVANDGLIKYYVVVPSVLTETIKQAITAAYPTARLEEVKDPNFFSSEGKIDAVVGGELILKKDFSYPIATYEDTKRDASLALINALSVAKKGDGIGIQIIIRPTDGKWITKSLQRVQNIRDGKKNRGTGMANTLANSFADYAGDMARALWEPPELHEKTMNEEKQLTNLDQEDIQAIENKTKFPGFQALIRIVASTATKVRSEALLNSVVSVYSQFDSQQYNGFRYAPIPNSAELAKNYIMREFPLSRKSMILNSMEMAGLFHLPSQNAIPTSQVERQMVKQVDGPAVLAEEGVILGINEFRGEQKTIRLGTKDRQRHTYVIGATGMGKSILLTNIAYQDMMDGRGFAFIDPHGDAAELIMSKVPRERMDDIIYFEPGCMDNPVGMNMFEYDSEDQKDFIVQECLNMLISLYDPGNQGIFGPRAQHMFRNAALLLMSDPHGGTFIDVPRCFIDPEFVKQKLKYVTDRNVYDYWTKEFPDSQKSNDAGEVTSWFVSKWGPFLSNKMMRNILGQTKSGFNIRQIMDNKKILLINLSKGKTGEMNARLLGMIFVMKFQAAAMSRQDIPEDQRQDFCLFVDEFQNFSTESFESILSEARKYKLNLVLANQFMTQLTDKIREAILGNVGTIMSGRLGVTDAELMEKAFSPEFTAEDLHKMANHTAVATVMMFGMPSKPFTMNLCPPMGEGSTDLMERVKAYALSKYGRPRAEVEAEIDARISGESEPAATASEKTAMPVVAPAVAAAAATMPEVANKVTTAPSATKANVKPKKNFLDSWLEKKATLEKEAKSEAHIAMQQKEAQAMMAEKKPATKETALATTAAPAATTSKITATPATAKSAVPTATQPKVLAPASNNVTATTVPAMQTSAMAADAGRVLAATQTQKMEATPIANNSIEQAAAPIVQTPVIETPVVNAGATATPSQNAIQEAAGRLAQSFNTNNVAQQTQATAVSATAEPAQSNNDPTMFAISHDLTDRSVRINNNAAGEMLEETNGSVWGAAAAINAETASVEQIEMQRSRADGLMHDDMHIDIRHNGVQVGGQAVVTTNTMVASATTGVIVKTAAQNAAGGLVTQNTDDGTILRWR